MVNFLRALQASYGKWKSKVVPKIFYPLVYQYMSYMIPWTINLMDFTRVIRLHYMAQLAFKERAFLGMLTQSPEPFKSRKFPLTGNWGKLRTWSLRYIWCAIVGLEMVQVVHKEIGWLVDAEWPHMVASKEMQTQTL